MANFKTPKIRSKKHLAYIRSLNCIIADNKGQWCNGKPVHAHHLTFGGRRGMGTKAGDDRAVPLCNFHHNTLHRMGEKRFWKMWGIEAELKAQELWEESNDR